MTIIGDSGHMPARTTPDRLSRPVPATVITGDARMFPGTGGDSE